MQLFRWQARVPRLQWHPPPLYFIHIPKTAGTAMEQFLLRVYGPQAFYFVPLRGLGNVAPAQLCAYRCWRSHSEPGLIPFLPQAQLHCFSLVREPVEQMASYLLHMRRLLVERPTSFDATYHQAMQPLIKADLHTWLEHPNSAYFDNFQTRHLGAPWDLTPWFKRDTPGHSNVSRRFPWEPAPAPVPSDMAQVFAQACRQVDQLDVIGITERFGESLELLCALLGVPVPQQIPTAHIGLAKVAVQTDFYRRQLTPDLLAQIAARTQYDRALYTYSCQQFATQQRARRRTISLAPHLLQPVVPVKAVTGRIKRNLQATWQAVRAEQ